ncbi:MAG: hypothetical protein RLZ92_468 [Pseudomonadota bacterium]|jgi:hypothetical protein
MYWDVIKVNCESDLSLSVTFKDGTQGKVVFKKTHLTVVFQALKDPHFFIVYQLTMAQLFGLTRLI